MREYKLAAIPGDGIGPAVIGAGLEVLQGCVAVDGGLDRLRTFDAIFFGAVGGLDVPDHVSLWGLRLPIAQGFDRYANARPARLLPGVTSPLTQDADIDWVIIRDPDLGGGGQGDHARRHRCGLRGVAPLTIDAVCFQRVARCRPTTREHRAP